MEPSGVEPWGNRWAALEALAWASLNRNTPPPPDVRRGRPHHGLPRLRLWNNPGGMADQVEPTTWTVFELFTETDRLEPVVRETVWRRSVDVGRGRAAPGRIGTVVALEPTVHERYAAVPADRLSALIGEAGGFRVPVTWSADTRSVTSDIGHVGFEFFGRDQPPASVRLTWSFVMPDEWKPVVGWYHRVRQFLEGCLSAAAGTPDARE